MFIQDTSGLRLSGGTLWDEMNLNPRYSAWITKGFYAFVFEDLGFRGFALRRDTWGCSARSAWCNYRNTLKQHGARQSRRRCWHISAKQAEPAGVRENARHQTTVKYWTRGGKKNEIKKIKNSSAAAAAATRGVRIWEDLCSVPSLNVSQEETAKLGGKSKRPKNKRSKWASEEQGGSAHARLRLFSSEFPTIHFF